MHKMTVNRNYHRYERLPLHETQFYSKYSSALAVINIIRNTVFRQLCNLLVAMLLSVISCPSMFQNVIE